MDDRLIATSVRPQDSACGIGRAVLYLSWECVMRTRRKIIVYIATSADGYIARPDGDVEWLNRRPRTVDYGMSAFYPTIDTILWGRKTYDLAFKLLQENGREGRDVRH